MNDQWVMISGGSRGIGKHIVQHLSNYYNVVFTYHRNIEKAESIVEELKKTRTHNVRGIQCDGTDSVQVEKLSKELIENYGAPYALVNNIGMINDNLFINIDFSSWQEQFLYNVHSTYLMTKLFVADMMSLGNGCVVNVSSVSALKGNVGQVGYSSTKASLIGFTKSLALELARFNIRVNSINPGFIETDMTKDIPEPSKIKKTIPLRRFGTPEEVAALVEFLLSKNASYITGQSIIMDGGLSA